MVSIYRKTEVPIEYRISSVARWYWCAEQSRHWVLHLVPPRPPNINSSDGTELHDEVITQFIGRRYPWEDAFMEILREVEDPVYGFKRKLKDNIYLTGHPDDYQVTPDGTVYVVEHKTTSINPATSQEFLERYFLGMAEFQSKAYSWLLEDILKHPKFKHSYHMGKWTEVCYWFVDHKEHTCNLIDEYPFQYSSHDTYNNLEYICTAYKNPDMIIPPKCIDNEEPWKCKRCKREDKAICQFQHKRDAERITKALKDMNINDENLK